MKSLLLYTCCPAHVKLADLGITGTLARRVRLLPLAALPAPRPQRVLSLRQERGELRRDIRTIGWALQQYGSGAWLPDAGRENGLQADLDASISRLRAVEQTLRVLEGGRLPEAATTPPGRAGRARLPTPSPLINAANMLKVKDDALLASVAAYVLLVLAPALLKLAGWKYFVQMSWTKATALVWGPWLLGAGFWLLLGLMSVGEWLLARRQLKLRTPTKLTSPRQ